MLGLAEPLIWQSDRLLGVHSKSTLSCLTFLLIPRSITSGTGNRGAECSSLNWRHSRSFYPDSDLDIYVEHRHCTPVALWLESIGYTFLHRNNIYQSKMLEIALTETLSSDFDMNNLPQGFFDSISVGYFGRGIANVVQVNPDRKVQLITSYR